MTERAVGGVDSGYARWPTKFEATRSVSVLKRLDVAEISNVHRSGSLKCFKGDRADCVLCNQCVF